MTKALSLLVCAVLLCGSMSVGAGALDFPSITQDEWNSYYEKTMSDGFAVMLSPGGDDTQMNVSWYSPACEGDSTVKLSENSDMSGARTFTGGYVTTPQNDRANKVTLTNLKSGTEYFYTCSTAAGNTDVYSFTTSGSDSFSAVYLTDIHMSYADGTENSLRDGSYTLDRTLRAASAKNDDISLVLSGGDQASAGLRCEYETLASSPVLKSVPFALALGNHDRKDIDFKYFKNVPNLNDKALTASSNVSDYWFVKDNVLFMIIDSNNANISDHRNFIKDAVKNNPDAKWRVAVFHHDLFGGRIESRESENKLLRTIWLPVLDEFAVDLTLMGHSHYYTMSDVIYDGESVEKLKDKDSVTDAAGTVYLVSGSVTRPRYDGEDVVPPLGENIAKELYSPETIYNVLNFSSDSITIDSYTLDSDEHFVSFTINKTSAEGGHPQYRQAWYTPFVRFISFIAGFFNTLDREFGYFWDHKVLPWWNGITK